MKRLLQLKKLLTQKKMRNILSILFVVIIQSCYFNSVGHKEIVSAQSAIDTQDFLKAEQKLENALRSDLSIELKIKVLHQLGVVKAFHLNDLKGALKIFQQTLEISQTPISKKKSSIYLADLYFSMLRDFEKSRGLYESLYESEQDLKIKSKYFQRYIKSLFETQKFEDVIIKLDNLAVTLKNFDLMLLKALSHYFLLDYLGSKEILKDLEKLQGLNRDQISGVKLFMALVLEDQEFLKLSYNEYLDNFQLFPNSNLIRLRIEKLIHRKRTSKR